MNKILSVNLPMIKTAGSNEPIKIGDTFVVATKERADMVKVVEIKYNKIKYGTSNVNVINVYFANPQNKLYKIEYNLDKFIILYYKPADFGAALFEHINCNDICFYECAGDYYNGKKCTFMKWEFIANLDTDSFWRIGFGSWGLAGDSFVIENNSIKSTLIQIKEFDLINGHIQLSIEDIEKLKSAYGDKETAINALKSTVKINGFDEEKKSPTKLGSITMEIYDNDSVESLQERISDLFENFS